MYIEAHKVHRFHELAGTNQDKVLELLRCAAMDPERHQIRAHKSGTRARPHGFRVELRQHNPTCLRITTDFDLGHWLFNHEFVTHGDVAWETFRFREDVIAWYRESHPLTQAEERERIGEYFYGLAVSDNDDEPFDAEIVAQKVGLSPDCVLRWVRALNGAGVLYDDTPKNSGIPPHFKLTRPKGFDWSIGGYRADLGATAQVDLNLTVKVDLDRVIEAIGQLQIPVEQKRYYELSVLKLERELKQGRVSWDTIKDALSTAANVKEVAVPIIRLVGSNIDQVAEAVAQLPAP